MPNASPLTPEETSILEQLRKKTRKGGPLVPAPTDAEFLKAYKLQESVWLDAHDARPFTDRGRHAYAVEHQLRSIDAIAKALVEARGASEVFHVGQRVKITGGPSDRGFGFIVGCGATIVSQNDYPSIDVEVDGHGKFGCPAKWLAPEGRND